MKRLLPLVLLICLGVGCGSTRASCAHRGVEIVLRAVPQSGESLTRAGMEQAVSTIFGRVVGIGLGEPKVTIRGADEIVVDFQGTHVSTRTRALISETGRLQFFDFEKDLASPTVKNGYPTPYPTLYSLLTTVARGAWGGTPAAWYLFDGGASHRVLQGPAATPDALLAPYRGKRPPNTTILTVPPNREVVSGPVGTAATKPVKHSPNGTYWYLLKLPPEISDSDLKESNIQAGRDPSSAVPQVTLGFTRHGAKEFQAITKAEYDRGKVVAGLHGSAGRLNQLYAQHNAIVLDGKLLTVPYIDYTQASLSLGIAGGSAVISNLRSIDAANYLAIALENGSLPYRFEQVSTTVCRP